MKSDRKWIYNIISVCAVVILALVEWCVHRDVEFMMDDLWYGTNLVTDEPLRNLWDVIESQVWHYLNWGGRSITHGLLQLILMTGEACADLLNVAVTLLLGWLVCVVCGEKRPLWFLAAFTMLVALNANWQMSMFWQSGAVNYVYSTAWIFLFLYAYVREMEQVDIKPLPFVAWWIVPIGIMTGWSNENMGPACFVAVLGLLFYWKKYKGRKLSLWMILGAAASGVGSIMVVVAPGNFVRTEVAEEINRVSLFDRLYGMLRAGADFLFPTLLIMLAVILIYTVCLKEKLREMHWFLLAIGILSYGAMILSPHYPDRATMGTMVVGITVIVSLLAECVRRKAQMKPYVLSAVLCCWVYAVYELLQYAYFVG